MIPSNHLAFNRDSAPPSLDVVRDMVFLLLGSAHRAMRENVID
jgi:hypothetical protein